MTLIHPGDLVIDHICLGAPDLEWGIQHLESLTGLSAMRLPSSPEAIFDAALLPLNDDRFIEIIAPRRSKHSWPFLSPMREMPQPRMVLYTVAVDDLGAYLGLAERKGFEVSFRIKVEPTARNPYFAYERACIGPLEHASHLPFVVQWSRRPSAANFAAHSQAALLDVTILHPDADTVHAHHEELGLDLPIESHETQALKVRLDVPGRGIVELL